MTFDRLERILIEILNAPTTTVSPDAWDENGGPCQATTVDPVLIVYGTETVHQDVIDFLQKLQEALMNHKAKRSA